MTGVVTPTSRTLLLRVVATLGRHVQSAGVASRLFDILREGIMRNDEECEFVVGVGRAGPGLAGSGLVAGTTCGTHT